MAETRETRPGSREPLWLWGALAAAVGLVLMLITLAYRIGGGDNPTWSPVLVFSVLTSQRHWPLAATVVLIVEVFAATAAGFFATAATGRLLGYQRRDAKPIDKAASTMANPHRVPMLNEKWSRNEAHRLAPGIPDDHPGYRGVLMGYTVRGNLPAYTPWEWVTVAVAGTRMGKTAALAIPAVVSAPGPVAATSNKPDIYHLTWLPRKRMGKLWLFDLQGVTTGMAGEASFYFNPLRPVIDLPSAKKVASYFVGAEQDDGAKVDSYFDGSAQDLLAAYMLAASLAGGDLIHAVEWMANEKTPVPAAVLRAHGEHAVARMLTSKQNVTERQRDGFYDMARRFLESLDAHRYAKAILPPRRVVIGVARDGSITTSPGDYIHSLPEFDPAAFATSTDTLYALSREGPDSAAALTTALMGQVLNQAEAAGARNPSGRLTIPMVAVLDEAANVCRLKELPDQYSHFGSRGIIPITILQSPSQGIKVWGKERFQIMCDAASCIWYGGNIDDKEFLGTLSELIDGHWVKNDQISTPTGLFASGQASRSTSWVKERILEVADLSALDSSRAILRLPGSKPLLLRKAYWQEGPFAAVIRESENTDPITMRPRSETAPKVIEPQQQGQIL
ncbi:type IV secretory system conjugative DNA transfer family protein [Nocardia niigatensis]